MDNDNIKMHGLDEVRLGATGGVDSTTSGTMLFDNFESRRESFIGPLASVPQFPPASAIGTPTPPPSGPPY